MQNSIFLDTLNGIKRERPPVWFMRQAGRVIPEYLALRERYSFTELLNTPELAAEVTLQPIELMGVDAAILFSDILVIPEAMGMDLQWTDKGPRFTTALKDLDDPIGYLNGNTEKLDNVYAAIDAIKARIPDDKALIGFCGAPLTTMFYMVQGLSSNHLFPDAVELMYKDKETTHKIFEKLTELSIQYALKQIEHGVQVFQLFETHAGLIPYNLYFEMVMPYVNRIAKAVRATGTPFIFFPKGLGTGLQHLSPESADFVSVDWQMSINDARQIIHPEIGIQGNLDPRLLTADQDIIQKELESYVDFGSKNHNWIFNLGHGFIPRVPFDNAKFVVDWVKSVDWKR